VTFQSIVGHMYKSSEITVELKKSYCPVMSQQLKGPGEISSSRVCGDAGTDQPAGLPVVLEYSTDTVDHTWYLLNDCCWLVYCLGYAFLLLLANLFI
jgi:hypothetical protein